MNKESAALLSRYSLSSRLLARAAFYLASSRKKSVSLNLDLVFKDALNKSQKRRFIIEYFEHLTTFCFETFSLILRPAKIRPVQVNLSESFANALMRNEGAVIAAAHMGHWEITLLHGLAKDPRLKNRLVVIKKNQKRLLSMLIQKIYAGSGVEIINQNGSLLKCLRALKQGKVVVIACDSKAQGKLSAKLDFLGKPASTYLTPAILADRAQVSVYCCNSFYNKIQHVVSIDELIASQHASSEEITFIINQHLSKYILQNPTQWIRWGYPRWK